MVESLMLTKINLKSDLIIIYGDIFFDNKIIEKISKLR